jgi:hypothetical protein
MMAVAKYFWFRRWAWLRQELYQTNAQQDELQRV